MTPGVQFINCVILEYVGTELDKYADFSPLYAVYDREKWYINMNQSVFTVDGRLITMNSFARFVSPVSGNIQATTFVLEQSREELKKASDICQVRSARFASPAMIKILINRCEKSMKQEKLESLAQELVACRECPLREVSTGSCRLVW